LSTTRYGFPGAEISQRRVVTVRGVFRGVVARRGRVIYIYRGDGLWYRFRLGVLVVEEREVDSQDKMRRERDLWIGGCV